MEWNGLMLFLPSCLFSFIWCAFSPASLFTDSHSGAGVCRFEFVYLCNDIADAVYRVTYIGVAHLVEVWKFVEQQPKAPQYAFLPSRDQQQGRAVQHSVGVWRILIQCWIVVVVVGCSRDAFAEDNTRENWERWQMAIIIDINKTKTPNHRHWLCFSLKHNEQHVYSFVCRLKKNKQNMLCGSQSIHNL